MPITLAVGQENKSETTTTGTEAFMPVLGRGGFEPPQALEPAATTSEAASF